jgi:hypothetical protein
MMLSRSVTVHGRECQLLVLPPDWKRPVKTNLILRAELSEGLTGVQSRAPAAAALRIGMSYTAVLDGSELQQLRQLASTLGDTMVLVPFWPDVLRAAPGGDHTDWDSRVFDGQVWVGWEELAPGEIEAGTDIVAAGAAPSRSWRGALLAGRLERWKATGVGEGMAEVAITIIEDAPWEFRITPAQSTPAGWSESWQPNWAKPPEQDVRVLLDRGSLGRGRESTIEGAPDVALWRQSASLTISSDQLGGLLAWYAAVGSHQVFELPGALRPGAPATGAPHDFDLSAGRMRFADREWRVEWWMPDIAEVRLQFEQQIETGTAQDAPAHAWLYQISYDGAKLYLTDWEAPVSAAGHTYQPARIEHGRIRQSLRPQNEECEVQVWLDDAPILLPLLRMESTAAVDVAISRWTLPAGGMQPIFTGATWKARAAGRKVRLTVAAFGGALSRKVPRFEWSRICNHTLFNAGCARARPAVMVASEWECVGGYTWQAAEGDRILLETLTFAPRLGALPTSIPSGEAGLMGTFAGGWLETGTGSARQVRPIINSWYAVEGATPRLYLYIPRPLREDLISGGHQVRFWPGCDGQWGTCQQVFDNGTAFGGFPWQPAWIEQAPIGMPSGGK